jgi:hypothetical protein
MYSGPLLHSGHLSDYTPLGEVGYPVYSAAPQIRLAIARQIGQDAADFLAVPKHHVEGKSIDWYAPVSGDIVPWSAASPEERAQLTGQIEQFRARIAEHAQKIRASAAEGDQRVFGLLLEQVTRIPDETHLFLVGNKPVITFWGFVNAGDDRRHDVLDRLRDAAPNIAVPRAAEPARTFGWRWLAFLLPLLLLLLLLWWALSFWRPFGITVPDFPIAIGPEPQQEEEQLQEGTNPDGSIVREGVIVGGTSTVTTDGSPTGTEEATTTDPSAPAGTEETPPEGETQDPNAQANTEQTPSEDQAQDPNAPPNPGANTDQANNPPTPPQPPIDPIDIPDNVNDPSFLAGEWRSETGLRDKQGNGAIMSYKFDEKGQGTTILKLADGSTCEGPSSASVNNGRVTIQDQGALKCSNGRVFRGSTTTCEKDPSNGKTRCKGSYGQGNDFNVVLGR